MKGVHSILSVVLLCATATASNAATAPVLEPESTISLFPEQPTRVWQIDWSGSDTKSMPLHVALASAMASTTNQTSPPPRATEVQPCLPGQGKDSQVRELCDAAAVRDRDRARAIAVQRSGRRQEDCARGGWRRHRQSVCRQ